MSAAVVIPLIGGWAITALLLWREIRDAEEFGYIIGRTDEFLGAPDRYAGDDA